MAGNTKVLILSVALTASVFIEGCSSTAQEGAVFGGILCAVAAAALSNPHDRGRNTAIAGAGCAVAGGVAGTIIDYRRREALQREQALDRQIEAGRENLGEMRGENQRLAQELFAVRQQVADIRRRRDLTLAQMQSVRQQIDDARQGARDQALIVENRIRGFNRLLAGQAVSGELRNKIAQMRDYLVARYNILSQFDAVTA